MFLKTEIESYCYFKNEALNFSLILKNQGTSTQVGNEAERVYQLCVSCGRTRFKDEEEMHNIPKDKHRFFCKVCEDTSNLKFTKYFQNQVSKEEGREFWSIWKSFFSS